MPRYIDTTGAGNLAIAVCPRCKMKRRYVDFVVDPNTGLRVCKFGCADLKDPYRLPARKTENISLKYPRPDEPLSIPVEYVVLEDGSYWVTDEGDFVVVDDEQISV